MLRRSSLIKRKELQARSVTETLDYLNRPSDIVKTNFTLYECTVQPFVGKDFILTADGLQSKSVYTIFTNTLVIVGDEGGSRKADEILIDNEWYRVVRVKQWFVGVIPHYEVVCIRIDEALI